MAFVFVSTLFGNIKVIAFAGTWNKLIEPLCQIGNTVMVKGKRSGDAVFLNEIELLEES